MATKQATTSAVKSKVAKAVKPKAVPDKAGNTSKRKTVDNDDLTVIVRETLFGLTARYELVQHYSTSGETILLKSNNQMDKDQVRGDASLLAKKLNVAQYEVR